MIQIDDAGSGSLIGGTGIGIYNTETKEYYFDIIPLEYYQTKLFETKEYQNYVIQIVDKAFDKLNVTKKESIEICPGYIFDNLKEHLTLKGYPWKNSKIEGDLQDKVEESFEQYVISLGLPSNFVKHARFAFGFHRLLKWVFADFENRKLLCKTEWKSWNKWSDVDRSIYKNTLKYKDYCLKCGKKIDISTNVITMEYQTLKPSTINLHPECFTGELNEIPPIFLKRFKTTFYPANKLDFINNIPKSVYLKKIHNNVFVINYQGNLIGYLKKDLEQKLIFWLNKGFEWECNLNTLNQDSYLLLAKVKLTN
ncbi:hypothetical protein SAMN00017405_0234 [Desulfonispora thiosulfatigenes DSM 11270]|uniref:Uncharacterized protein n=1 Tax=Desulfonispora thiosulfatigenes DSM 11270 TaxID=656914 RepID=A0A1W1VMP9_DESTI|nr:hypothetical protein [Desulfonispora thiosulfatigenes]SMB94563.1 hypothetical protein SAMN00017405_0234 [Desulfonispora thiosulfatigenes DSM 11270]